MLNPSITLLIIDDDPVVRARLASYLEAAGFAVLEADNGVQGMQLIQEATPDLIICDLYVPQLTGLELLAQLNEQGSETPVILLSASGSMSDAVESLRLGAADYLTKPLDDLAVLEHSVRRALQEASLLLENRLYRETLEATNRELQTSLSLLEEDQNAGRQMQLSMLPQTPWQADDYQFAHQVIPSLYLSGDFVDYFRLDQQRIAFYLADVSGHGASSAFVTVLLKFMTTRLLYESRRDGQLPQFKPSAVLGHINRGLLNCKLGKHVTMIGGIIDQQTNQLTYCIGGHLPLPVLYSEGKARFLEGKGLPVGLFEEAAHEDYVLDLPDSFSLTMLSDGILEVLPGASLKDKEASLPGLISAAGGSLEGMLETLGLAAIDETPDDIAVLVLSRNLA
ncbi:Serine phosphatase RsbU, regulator of sigma subunit [Pseudomonas pohangensis]|jgi:serine phosphatase RsbU (regulator of sigma subunit)|uniref:Serine phosphatase RsbU, regulator of sigma subunit n=1 Tax=Pseudomonas pohangensis TaxID=364197 RepID=A0A1H2F6W4_9PSED|nr:two-component system response regulator RssB [Pseudomonas pohangensis]SDU03094.1 Serine phosphatase RsbU, regulator of sigma subunit [Pseudomonas pohangensis]